MKTIFALLLGLLLLESCGKANVVEGKVVLPALQGICDANDGILVILIDKTGVSRSLPCPNIGGKPIKKEQIPDPSLSAGNTFVLGTVTKLQKSGDPDPCIDWYVGKDHYYYCWK